MSGLEDWNVLEIVQYEVALKQESWTKSLNSDDSL